LCHTTQHNMGRHLVYIGRDMSWSLSPDSCDATLLTDLLSTYKQTRTHTHTHGHSTYASQYNKQMLPDMHALPYIAIYTAATERSFIELFPPYLPPPQGTAVGQCYKYITYTIYRLSQEECARLREGVPYVILYRYNPKHLCPKLNG